MVNAIGPGMIETLDDEQLAREPTCRHCVYQAFLMDRRAGSRRVSVDLRCTADGILLRRYWQSAA